MFGIGGGGGGLGGLFSQKLQELAKEGIKALSSLAPQQFQGIINNVGGSLVSSLFGGDRDRNDAGAKGEPSKLELPAKKNIA